MDQHVLLIGINAKFIHSNLAIHSLKAYADKYYPDRPAGCTIEIAEYTINQSPDDILADIYQKKPQIAAFSCYIWNWSMIRDLLAELPKILPDTLLWLGGPEVSFHADSLIAQLPQLAGIMIGEGEETFLELLRHYWEQAAGSLEIRGIACKEGLTGERPLIDIDQIPFPYGASGSSLASFQDRILYYESQRGCPFRCAYCLSSIDKKVRLRSIDIVKDELGYLLAHNVPQVKFIDRTFNCDPQHALAIWRYLKEHDNGVTNFHFEIAADLVTDEHLDVMRGMRPGLIQLEIGVQSTDKETLKAIGRRMDIGRLREVTSAIHSFHNIHQHLDLIAGLPYEDLDSFARSFDEVHEMAPDQLQLGFLKVLKGSPMEERAAGYGIAYSSRPPYEVLRTRWLPYEDLRKLKGIEEMVALYHDTGQFQYTLPVLLQAFPSPFSMYGALAEHYRRNGYLTQAPSRIYRYQALLDLACETVPEKQALFAELLTFDLYLRENLKSRPVFSPAPSLCGEELRRFYETEAAAPRFLKKGYEGKTAAQLMRMAHVEQFTYGVWKEDPAERACLLPTPARILFDYHDRSPLTHNAAFHLI